MSTYIALQADAAPGDPQNLLAIPVGGGDYSLAVALYVDAATSPTPLTSAMLGAYSTPTTLYAGSATAGTAAAAIGTAACSSVLVQADPSGTVPVYVGNASAQAVQLLPGMSVPIRISNVNAIYVKTASGTCLVNWMAS